MIVLSLVLGLTACSKGGKLVLVKSNLADYNQNKLDPSLKEIRLEFNKPIAKVDINLTENGEKKEGFKTKVNDKQLVINNLHLQPTSIYYASLMIVDKEGNKILKTIKLKTKRTSYPAVKDYNQTMLQTFYWFMNVNKDEVEIANELAYNYADKYPGEENLWKLLDKRAEEFAAAGITSLWLPPAQKSHEQRDEGYGVYDPWDLGEFKQQGTVRTKYGTKEELETAIASLHQAGIEVYYDLVLNQRIGGGLETAPLKSGSQATVKTDYTNLKGRQKYYSQADQFAWDWQAFDGVNWFKKTGYSDKKLFKGKEWDDATPDYLIAADVDYQNHNVQHEMKEWGSWIINEIGFDGFRMDAIKHVHTPYIKDWIAEVQSETEKDVFYVGEVWFENDKQLGDYLAKINNDDLNIFDFSLRTAFENMSKAEFDIRKLKKIGLVNSQYGDKAVTFVDNHDTSRGKLSKGVASYKYQAYAYILLREKGRPCIFWKDYYQQKMKEGLDKLLVARKHFAYGPGYEVNNNDKDVYSYVRAGRDKVQGDGLVMMISDGYSQEIATKKINSRQPNTRFYDLTGNVKGFVKTNENGIGHFKVHQAEENGWSVWVPRQKN